MISRQRLINAIIYFASNTNNCGKIKLFKLLYLLDFEHFRQTGKNVTGYNYQAWKFGPVPPSLMEEWEELGADLEQCVEIVEEKVFDHLRQSVRVKAGVTFDEDLFSNRQLSIMQAFASQYRDAYSPKMIDVTHAQNGAWDKVWQNGHGAQQPIPYDLAIPDSAPERDAILKIAAEQRMYETALQSSRLAATD